MPSCHHLKRHIATGHIHPTRIPGKIRKTNRGFHEIDLNKTTTLTYHQNGWGPNPERMEHAPRLVPYRCYSPPKPGGASITNT